MMPKETRVSFISGLLIQVDDYNPSSRLLKQMIKINRNMGIKDETFFLYGSLNKRQKFFSKAYQNY